MYVGACALQFSVVCMCVRVCVYMCSMGGYILYMQACVYVRVCANLQSALKSYISCRNMFCCCCAWLCVYGC